MPKGLNKRILGFVDEYGTAGAGQLHIGAVFVLARDAGRLDKAFTDLLEPNVSEVHAVRLEDGYLQGLMQRLRQVTPAARTVLVNQKATVEAGLPSTIYAQAVVQTVKAGLRRFQREVLGQETIGNVELILDRNAHNTAAAFDAVLARAQAEDGRFRGVEHVARIDSAASRLLQLADCVAYARKWIANGEVNAKGLRERFGIELP